MNRSRNTRSRKRQTTINKETSQWQDRMVKRAMEDDNDGTTLLTKRPQDRKERLDTSNEWTIVGEKEIDGSTLLTRGSKVKVPVFGDKNGKPYAEKYQPYLRHVHLLTTDPTYAKVLEANRKGIARQQTASERSWTRDGMERYLKKTGHGQRAMDVFERERSRFLPTRDPRAVLEGSKVKMPVTRSDLAASLTAVHESVHADEPGWSDDLLDNVVEEYIATRKQVEAYKDLKRQGLEPKDPAEKAKYESFEKLYDLDEHNDALARFIFEEYVPYYRKMLSKPEKSKRNKMENRETITSNSVDNNFDLQLFEKFKQKIRVFQ